jgi:hypothetical protein
MNCVKNQINFALHLSGKSPPQEPKQFVINAGLAVDY